MAVRLFRVTLVYLLAQTVIVGSAIKCYTCSSETDPKCGDPADVSDLAASECLPNILQMAVSAGLKFLNNFFPMSKANLDLQIACLKVVTTETNGDKVTIRSCSLADTDTFDSCGAFEAADKLSTGRKMSFCGLCSTDACNSTDRLRPGAFILPLVLSGLIALFTACIA